VRHPPAAAQIHLNLRGTGTTDVRADPSPISYSDGGGAFAEPTPDGATRLLRSDRSRRGTIVCDVADIAKFDRVIDVAVDLNAQLGLRLVLVVAAVDSFDAAGCCLEGFSASSFHEGTQRLVRRILFLYGPGADVECRIERGRRAAALARVAKEEQADLVLIGSPPSRVLRGSVRVEAIGELRMASPCPVVVVPS
jgi:nucleotide-binding universal stress UspA family protein